ncbi:LURP-one-related 10-like protein [Tanacetum coccineum]
MDEVPGSMGTSAGFALRLGQTIFSSASLIFMSFGGQFYSYTSFGNIVVTDINYKIIFKVKPCNTYFHQQRLLLHADDRPIAMLQDKLMTEHKRWKVYKGDSTAKSDMIFSTKTAKVIQTSKTDVHVLLENKKRNKDACDFMIKVALIAIVDATRSSTMTNKIVEVVTDGVIETALGGFGM